MNQSSISFLFSQFVLIFKSTKPLMSFKDLIKMPKRQRGIIEHAEPSTSQENINFIGSQLGLTKKGRKKYMIHLLWLMTGLNQRSVNDHTVVSLSLLSGLSHHVNCHSQVCFVHLMSHDRLGIL